MADVKICDRCGKRIEATMVKKISFGAFKYSLFDPDRQTSTHSMWDLCTDCGEMLKKFLNGFDPNEKPDDALIIAR